MLPIDGYHSHHRESVIEITEHGIPNVMTNINDKVWKFPATTLPELPAVHEEVEERQYSSHLYELNQKQRAATIRSSLSSTPRCVKNRARIILLINRFTPASQWNLVTNTIRKKRLQKSTNETCFPHGCSCHALKWPLILYYINKQNQQFQYLS